MKVLTFCAYYEPEIAASMYLTTNMFEDMAKSGIEVEIFAPTPTRGVDQETINKYKKIKYEEHYDGKLKIHRFSMLQEGTATLGRAIRYILLNLAFIWKGLWTQADLMLISSTPPTQGFMAALLKKAKKIPVVYNLQDIFPDSLVTTGLAKKGGLLWKIGRKIENYTYRNADHIIVISEGFKRNIMAKGVEEAKITAVPNWVNTDSVYPVAKTDNRLFEELQISRDKFTVVYAGNFGEAQGADVVLKAAQRLKEQENIQFVLFGGGARFGEAKEQAAAMDNVAAFDLLPPERVSEVYSLGDVALITCKPGAGDSAMPSKTWSIMACSTPIIASFDTDSDLAQVLADSCAGICVEPGNTDALAKAILEASKTGIKGSNGREYVAQNASRDICVKKYLDIILEAANGSNRKNNNG